MKVGESVSIIVNLSIKLDVRSLVAELIKEELEYPIRELTREKCFRQVLNLVSNVYSPKALRFKI